MLAVGARRKVAAEVGVASLSVPVLSVALWGQGETYGGKGSERKRQHSLFFWGKVVRAD